MNNINNNLPLEFATSSLAAAHVTTLHMHLDALCVHVRMFLRTGDAGTRAAVGQGRQCKNKRTGRRRGWVATSGLCWT
jgi:hypothetical protein